MDMGNWRQALRTESRQNIVKRIMDTLQKHMPHSGEEGMNELLEIASRFEERIFQTASDQQDYLRRISVKMLALESKSQNNINNSGNATTYANPMVGGSSIDMGNWRQALRTESRQKIVKRIMDTLQEHMTHSGEEGMNELLEIASRFEEKIFQIASDQEDYHRRILVKIFSLESKSQNNRNNSRAGRKIIIERFQ